MKPNPVLMNQVEMNTRLIKAMVIQGGLRAFVSGINNAFCHGEVFNEGDCGDIVSDKQLEELYVAIDRMAVIATDVDKA